MQRHKQIESERLERYSMLTVIKRDLGIAAIPISDKTDLSKKILDKKAIIQGLFYQEVEQL